MSEIFGTNGDDTLDGTAGPEAILGGDGNDTINGNGGNDTLLGEAGNDTITGGSDVDSIQGGSGNDTMHGLGGNDYIDGSTGTDQLYGGDGGDYLIVADLSTGDIISGGAGTDTLRLDYSAAASGFAVDFSALFPSGSATVNGATITSIENLAPFEDSQFADSVTLGAAFTGLFQLYFEGGDDYFSGGSGVDEIRGGDGADTLYGNAGNDRLFGDIGTGQDGNDQIYGGAGMDQLGGNGGDDTLDGGADDDSVSGDEGNDTVYGGDGNDFVAGGDGSDTVYGGAGNDSVAGRTGNMDGFFDVSVDYLYGEGGNDIIYVGGGDIADGGAGIDTLELDLSSSSVGVIFDFSQVLTGATIQLGSGSITGFEALGSVLFSQGDDIITVGNAQINGYSGLQAGGGNDTVTGGSFNDSLFGGSGNDNLYGLGGNDYLVGSDGLDLIEGGAGDDQLLAGTGADQVWGGIGNDAINGEAGDDILYGEDGNDGIDTGDGDDQAYGGAGNDELSGNAGNDLLDGGDGDDVLRAVGGFGVSSGTDTMIGGAGNDTYYLDTNAHQIIEAAGGGLDTVFGSNVTLAANVENLVIGSGTGTGNDLANVITGSDGDNTVHGNGGNDTINGSFGIDSLFGDDGDDALNGGFGNDVLDGGAGNDNLDGWSDNDIVSGGAGNDTVLGSLGDDQLNGDDGNDNLNGGEGTDSLAGGAGNDILAGGLGNDTLDGGSGSDWGDYTAASSAVAVNLAAAGPQNTGSLGNDTLISIENLAGSEYNDSLTGNDGANALYGGPGNDTLTGGSNVDTAVFAGNRAAYAIFQTSTGVFQVVGPDGTDVLSTIEYLEFADVIVRPLPGTGTAVNFSAPASTWMGSIRDFDGNDLGAASGWKLIGSADVDGDGDQDRVLVNPAIGRFAEVATGPDGLVYFSDYSWAGETRVVGIYIDPLVTSGQVVQGGPFDSQRRFQNDLQIDNIAGVLGAGDYDRDGLQEVYFRLTDGTAYLHAYMHADGNIRYANYQNQQQVIDFLTANGWASSTWAGWFPSGAEAPKAAGFAGDSFGFDEIELASLSPIYTDDGMARWAEDHFAMQPLV